MKIISDYKELAGQVFDSVEKCAAEEAKIDEAREKAKKAATSVANRKKALTDKVDAAEKSVKLAYDQYNKAKEEVRKILEESNKKMNEILANAEGQVTKAESDRRDAIIAYNKEFGAYQAVYTGDRAQKEFDRIIKQMDNSLTDMIRKFII